MSVKIEEKKESTLKSLYIELLLLKTKQDYCEYFEINYIIT